MTGLSTTGSISFGMAFVWGKNLVPKPAAGITTLVIFFMDFKTYLNLTETFWLRGIVLFMVADKLAVPVTSEVKVKVTLPVLSVVFSDWSKVPKSVSNLTI